MSGVVPRWSDRVNVTGLKNVAWDQGLVDDLSSSASRNAATTRSGEMRKNSRFARTR